MKKGILSAFVLLCILTSVRAQQVTRAEYFFNSDPGFGLATSVTITAGDSVNATTDIPIPAGLNAGINILFVRVADNNNVWSMPEVKLIWISGASAAVSGMEYFFDTDPGFGLATPITISTAADSVSVIQNIPVPSLSIGAHKLYVRTKNAEGTWSFPEVYTMNICTAYGPTPLFSSHTSGVDVYFTDSSANSISRTWNFGDNSAIDTSVNPHHIFPSGNTYAVKLKTVNACGTDSLVKNIIIPGVQSISPIKIAATGIYIGYIKGAGFLPGTTSRLLKNGTISIAADTTIYMNPGLLKVIYKNQDEVTGLYDVRVTIPGSGEQSLVNAVTMEPAAPMDIWVNLVGRRELIVNRWTTYRVAYGNNGNTTAVGVPIWISLSGHVQAKLITPVQDSAIQPSFLALIQDQFFMYKDSATGDSARNCLLLLPYIEPGKTGEIIFEVKTTSSFEVSVQTGNGFISDADVNINGRMNSTCYPPCVQCIIDLVTSVPGVPSPVACPFAGMGAICDIADALNDDETSNGSKAVSIMGTVGSTILSCSGVDDLVMVNTLGKINWGKVGLFAAGTAAGSLPGVGGIMSNCRICFKDPNPDSIWARFSWDPNVKTGPVGYNTQKYTRWQKPFNYSIEFENLASASAPASEVTITDYLDSTRFDLSTIRFTGFGFADTSFNFAESESTFIQDVDLRPAKQAIVRYKGSLDSLNKLSFSFTTLDPATMNLTNDFTQGFLNPNTDGKEGLGYVKFQVRPKTDLPTGTAINNIASIVFDANPAITTPLWFNSIDKENPSSHVLPVTERINDTTYKINWTGSDAHAGVFNYRIFVSVNDSAFYEWMISDTTTANITVHPSNIYKFYSVATDFVGNIEDTPGVPDQTLTVTLPITLLEFNAYKQNKTVLLRWKTSSEQDNRGFEIQRSGDGTRFTPIGWVDGSNNAASITHYSFTDSIPLAGKNFYRLKQLDIDNRFKLSETRKIDIEQLVEFSVFPNPASGELNLQSSSTLTGIRITDLQGRLLFEKQSPGLLQLRIPIQHLPNGLFFLEVTDRNGNREVQKFIKAAN